MPKTTKPLVVPEYEYGNGTPTIGEIVLDMAQELLIDTLTQPNQLDVQRRRAKFVRQVNKTFAVELKEEVRKAKAGEKGGLGRIRKAQEKNDEYRLIIEKCLISLIAKKKRITVKTIRAEHGAELNVSDRRISQIKKEFLSQP